VRFVAGAREEPVVALDWSDFEGTDYVTLCAYAATSHGRATPLVWRTVRKAELRGKWTEIEHEVLEMPHRRGAFSDVTRTSESSVARPFAHSRAGFVAPRAPRGFRPSRCSAAGRSV
jgi:hypothetical protein